MSSRQRTGAHAAFALSQDENWAEIADAQKRKRVQNRLAQRSYRHKVRERLQELDQIKTAEHGSGPPSQSSSRRSSSQTSECNAATQGRSASTVSMNPPPAISRTSSGSSDSCESALFSLPGFNDSPFPWTMSPEKATQETSGIDDFLAGLYATDNNEAVTLASVDLSVTTNLAVTSSQTLTAPSSTKATDFGFDLLGPVNPPATPAQDAEMKFTELMLKLREVGFVDMESMVLEYYTTQFRRDSLPYWLQRRSRQHNLCKLLEQIQMHSSSWPVEEGAAFQDSIQSIAQQAMGSELSASNTLLSFPPAMSDDYL